MANRPDWMKCVLTGKEHKTWCGRSPNGFVFNDPTHAALNGKNGGRFVVCPDCAKAIAVALGLHFDAENRVGGGAGFGVLPGDILGLTFTTEGGIVGSKR